MSESKKPHFLALGGIDHTYRAIGELGAEYSLMQSRALVTDFQIKSARELLITQYEDTAKMVDYARAMHARHPIDYVLCLSEYPQLAAARIAAELGLPSNCDAYAVEATRNKAMLRDLLDRAGLPTVPWRIVKTADELRAFRDEVGGAVVAKPVSGAGSEGVHLVVTDDDVTKAFGHADGIGRDGVLAEQFIGGQEYSVESMSANGRHEIAAVTRKTVTGAPYFVEMAHVQPCCPGEYRDQIADVVSRMLTALGHRHGPAHTELKIDEDGLRIIESQVRLGGDQIWEMTLFTSGVDVARETLHALLGLPAPERRPLHPVVAIQFLQFAKIDADRQAIEAACASDHPDVLRVRIDNSGSEDMLLTQSGHRSGYVMVRGETVEQAEALAREQAEAVTRKVETMRTA
ncbi:MAG: ATP-grasp domain-containing protein [Lysobacteraceae bacterium]|nr:MAG: ATP-grasp domain-containing protein [Xanthomonadaceae bacterium]